jgi:23S rRNA (pseudouridine1915-N3)-methyltransferase
MAFSITILAPGKSGHLITQEVERYVRLLRPWASVEILVLKTFSSENADAAHIIAKEEKNILMHLPAGAHAVVMTEEGRLMNSRQFSLWLGNLRQQCSRLVFIIGGAHGFSGIFKKKFEAVSLSPLTFPHRLALEILAEQMYRAFTILSNHPYHK